MLSRGKIITAKVFVGILCTILILGTVFMTTILFIFSKSPVDPAQMIIKYKNLPNVCGDDCVYVSENFFVDNKLNIPDYIEFNVKRCDENYVIINGGSYYGRSNELGYDFAVGVSDKSVLNDGYVWISCTPKNINKLKNKQVHNGVTYGLESKQFAGLNGNEYNSYIYTVNFSRNAHTSKKCQLTFSANIKYEEGINIDLYKQVCDNMFYSLLDNIVYRNV